jgi:dTDP-4-amino-4,6-dideoxygalactose transaminase
MLIRQTPAFSFKDIFRKGSNNIDVYPMNSKNIYLFFGARYAIWAGIKTLKISPDQNILMPSYNCGTEIDPILDQGIQIKYYRINRNMRVDVDDIKKQVDAQTAAIFITHYIGFPQSIDEIRKICRINGLFLIEDCAHAFLSDYKSRNLGTFGDISVFSIRKTIPIPNGGALVINNENFIFEEKQRKGSSLSTFFVAVELLNNRTQNVTQSLLRGLTDMVIRSVAFISKIFQLFLRVIKKIISYKGLALIHINYYCREFNRELSKWKISTFSKIIMSNMKYEKIKQSRRKNFEYLLSNLLEIKDVELVFKSLPEGICPLFFPVIVKDRQFYYQVFKERGITLFNYWQHMHNTVPWDDFPEAVFLKKHVLGFPIHQDISFNHLDRIIEIFKVTPLQNDSGIS